MQQWVCHIKGLERLFVAREIERIGRQIDGVNKLVVDFSNETIVLQAESRDALKHLEIKLAGLGYEVLNRGYSVISEIRVDNLNETSSQAYIRKRIGGHTFVSRLDIRPLSKIVMLTHSSDYSVSDFICDLNNHGIKANLQGQQLAKSGWQKLTMAFEIICVLLFLIGGVFDFVLGNESVSFFLYLASVVFSLPLVAMKAGRQFMLDKKINHELMLVFLVGVTAFLQLWFVAALIGVCYLIWQQAEFRLMLSLRQKWTKIRSHESAVAFIKPNKADAVIEQPTDRIAVTAASLSSGSVVNIKQGEVLAIDGVVVHGEGQFDEVNLSSATKTVKLVVGDIAYAGMRLVAGEVDVRASGANEVNKVRLLHRKLESMQTKITQTQLKMKTYFEYVLSAVMLVSASIVFAILGFDVNLPETVLMQSLAVMLVSSSAFIVVSIQYSQVFLSLVAAGNGLYFFMPDYWKKLANIETVILDKTGVVTCNQPQVQEVISLSTHAIKAVLRVAETLSFATDDARFAPIRDRAAEDSNNGLKGEKSEKGEKGKKWDEVTGVEVVDGKSVSGNIDGKFYRIGSQSVFEQAEMITPQIRQTLKRWEEEGANILLVADDSHIFGLITIIDPVRDEISAFIDCAHKKLGLKVVMLSHDNVGTSRVLAQRYGFDDVISEMTDGGKAVAIEKYAGKKSVLLISNRIDLVLAGRNQFVLVNEALASHYFGDEKSKGENKIVSLGVRLMASLNLMVMAKKMDARIKRLLGIVGFVKLVVLIGIFSGYLSLAGVVGVEFALATWVLLSTYRPTESTNSV